MVETPCVVFAATEKWLPFRGIQALNAKRRLTYSLARGLCTELVPSNLNDMYLPGTFGRVNLRFITLPDSLTRKSFDYYIEIQLPLAVKPMAYKSLILERISNAFEFRFAVETALKRQSQIPAHRLNVSFP